MRKVLILDDNAQDREAIKRSLDGLCSMVTVSTCQQAKEELARHAFDLVLVEPGLKSEDGSQIFNILKEHPCHRTAVFVTSHSGNLDDKVRLFQAGAHDYIVKPFESRELQSRVQALFKRLDTAADETVSIGDLRFSLTNQKAAVLVSGQENPLDLTTLEFKLLLFFAKRENTLMSRDKIIRDVWRDHTNITNRAVDTHISHLRKKIKLSQWQIDAVYGEGYRFSRMPSTKV